MKIPIYVFSLMTKYGDQIQLKENKVVAMDSGQIVELIYEADEKIDRPIILEANTLSKVLEKKKSRNAYVEIIPEKETVQLIFVKDRASKKVRIPIIEGEEIPILPIEKTAKNGAKFSVDIKPKGKEATVVIDIDDSKVRLTVKNPTGEIAGEVVYEYDVLEKYGDNVEGATYSDIILSLISDFSSISREIELYAGKDEIARIVAEGLTAIVAPTVAE